MKLSLLLLPTLSSFVNGIDTDLVPFSSKTGTRGASSFVQDFSPATTNDDREIFLHGSSSTNGISGTIADLQSIGGSLDNCAGLVEQVAFGLGNLTFPIVQILDGLVTGINSFVSAVKPIYDVAQGVLDFIRNLLPPLFDMLRFLFDFSAILGSILAGLTSFSSSLKTVLDFIKDIRRNFFSIAPFLRSAADIAIGAAGVAASAKACCDGTPFGLSFVCGFKIDGFANAVAPPLGLIKGALAICPAIPQPLDSFPDYSELKAFSNEMDSLNAVVADVVNVIVNVQPPNGTQSGASSTALAAEYMEAFFEQGGCDFAQAAVKTQAILPEVIAGYASQQVDIAVPTVEFSGELTQNSPFCTLGDWTGESKVDNFDLTLPRLAFSTRIEELAALELGESVSSACLVTRQ